VSTADEQPHEAPQKLTDGRIKKMENTKKKVEDSTAEAIRR